jgi:guanylate kinase
MTDTGNLYVIAAPSGAGKTSLVKALTETTPNITVSISHTTRPKRPNEVDGINYHFISSDDFKRMIAQGDFLEHATIFENLYGTSRKAVESQLAQGKDVILEIDWQGHQQIKQLFPESISIFILPPSPADLRNRLIKRDQDKLDVIEKRLADAKEAISHLDEFDYAVINDDFDKALLELKIIVGAGCLLRRRQSGRLAALVNHFD